MGRWISFVLLVMVFAAGCSPQPVPKAEAPQAKATPPVAPPPADPEQALYEQLRAGNYQVEAALTALERAHALIKEMPPENEVLGEASVDLTDLMNSAGGTLAEIVHQPPTLAALRKDFAKGDERRLAAIDKANDALRELREARGITSSLIQDAPPEAAKALTSLNTQVDEAVEATAEAVKALGGTPAKEEAEPAP